jgi:hypothetical protein
VAADARPAGCPTGNEQGIQVTFTCSTQTPPGGDGNPIPPARVDACDLQRRASGAFELVILGSNIKNTATVTIGGKAPKKLKFQQQQSNGTFNRVKARGGICSALPGPIVINNNDQSGNSTAFQCNESCPAQQ